LCANGVYQMVIDVEQSRFSGMVLAVGRLVRVKEIVSREMSG